MPEDEKTKLEEGTGEETPPESSPETKPEGQNPPPEGDNTQDEFKDVPFHAHPRWKQREQEWNTRFEQQEAGFAEKLEKAVSDAVAKNAPKSDQRTSDRIPVWFGGGKDTPEIRGMWNEYKDEQKQAFSDIEKQAEARALERVNQTETAREKAIADANQWFENSVTKIEAAKGQRVNRDELLKYVLDNKIIDVDTQRWDYEKGYRWMMAEKKAGQGSDPRQERRKLADGTMSDSGHREGGAAEQPTTSEDFKSPSKRPW